MARDTHYEEISVVTKMKEPPTTGQVLRRAHEIIKNPAHWCQGAAARPAGNGRSVGFDSDLAARFCADGAILRAEFELGRKPGVTIPLHSRVGLFLRWVNDGLGHRATVLIMRFMISRCRD